MNFLDSIYLTIRETFKDQTFSLKRKTLENLRFIGLQTKDEIKGYDVKVNTVHILVFILVVIEDLITFT